MRGMTCLIGRRRQSIGAITRRIRTHTGCIGDGKLTHMGNSLESQFLWMISPISSHLSRSRSQLYHHLSTRIKSSLSISPCHDQELAPSTAYTEYSIHRVQHTPSTAYTEYSIHRVQHILSTPYTDYTINQIHHIPGTPYTEHTIHRVHHTPSTPYTEYTIHRVHHTPSTPYTEFTIHRVNHTQSTPYTEYTIHRVHHTPSAAYPAYSIHRVQHTPSTVYTEYCTHRILHHPMIECPLLPPISHLSADNVVCNSLHSHNYELTNEYSLSSHRASLPN